MNTNTETYMELQAGDTAIGSNYMRFDGPDPRKNVLKFVADQKAIETVIERIELEKPRILTFVPPKPKWWKRAWEVLNMDVLDVWALLKEKWYGRRP